jgi:hypothetical protein
MSYFTALGRASGVRIASQGTPAQPRAGGTGAIAEIDETRPAPPEGAASQPIGAPAQDARSVAPSAAPRADLVGAEDERRERSAAPRDASDERSPAPGAGIGETDNSARPVEGRGASHDDGARCHASVVIGAPMRIAEPALEDRGPRHPAPRQYAQEPPTFDEVRRWVAQPMVDVVAPDEFSLARTRGADGAPATAAPLERVESVTLEIGSIEIVMDAPAAPPPRAAAPTQQAPESWPVGRASRHYIRV